jgi:hypothetical protein
MRSTTKARNQRMRKRQILKVMVSWVFWCKPAILAFGKLRQEDCKFEASLDPHSETWFKDSKTHTQNNNFIFIYNVEFDSSFNNYKQIFTCVNVQ